MIITVPVCNYGRIKKEERCCCDSCGNYSMKEISKEEKPKDTLFELPEIERKIQMPN